MKIKKVHWDKEGTRVSYEVEVLKARGWLTVIEADPTKRTINVTSTASITLEEAAQLVQAIQTAMLLASGEMEIE